MSATRDKKFDFFIASYVPYDEGSVLFYKLGKRGDNLNSLPLLDTGGQELAKYEHSVRVLNTCHEYIQYFSNQEVVEVRNAYSWEKAIIHGVQLIRNVSAVLVSLWMEETSTWGDNFYIGAPFIRKMNRNW